jgi:predicted DsbA family dithiol-disulfide isomerase
MATNGKAQEVQFYFDPICPWAWRTSLWIREAAKVRPIDVRWKFLSLDLVNRAAGNEPKPGHLQSWKPFRAMALARRQGGQEAVDRLYLAIGRARHERQEPLGDEGMIAAALDEAGLDRGLLAAALADASTEQEVREEHAGIAATGGFGVPTLVVDGVKPLFGPVIDDVPEGEAAGELWDRVRWLMDHPNFLELKRARD